VTRSQEYDVTLDGVGLILTDDGLDVQRVQANPFAMKSSTGERSYADLDEWAVFQIDTLHRGMGQDRYGDPEMFWFAKDLDTRFKGKAFAGPEGVQEREVTGADTSLAARFGTKIFYATGNRIYERTVSNTWILRETATASITGLQEFNGYLYAAQGASNTMRKTADGTTWSDVGGTPNAYRLYVHGGYLYRSLNQVLYYSSDPDATTPTWSDGINVSDSQYIIESMVTFDDALIVFKNDGGYRVPGNPGEIDEAFPIGELNWEQSIDARNGLQCCVWSDGYLYVFAGKGAILRWTGKTVTPMGPDNLSLATSEIGYPVSMVSTTGFLYVNSLLTSGSSTNSNILAWNGSGWHSIIHIPNRTPHSIFFFDPGSTRGGYLFVFGRSTVGSTYSVVDSYYLPTEIQDPIKSEDSSYLFDYTTGDDQFLQLSRFTAGMHDAQKEFRSITVWAENYGLASGGTQQIRVDYRIDTESANDWITLATLTIEADDRAKKSYIADFPVSSFADKTITSVSSRTVTLATGTTVDMAVGDWVYFASVNEYRAVTTITDATHFDIQCPLDDSPTANSALRPGIPWGRFIDLKLFFFSGSTSRTAILNAVALKYLVNITDYDIWTVNAYIANSVQRRGQTIVREPVADQLTRLNEIRRKGRVTFVDEVGDSHTVKVSNYTLLPVRQDTATSQVEPHTEYHARLTLLEV